MSHVIGVDFGTTNSIISKFENGNFKEFEGAGRATYIKSAIAFDTEKNENHIGNKAISFRKTNHLYRYFKMYLNIDKDNDYKSNLKKAGWNQSKEPYEVAKTYLKELITNKDSGLSFVGNEGGTIKKIALTIPALWISNVKNTGYATLKKILTDELGFKNHQVRLISEPQAAAAYFLWNQRKKKESFNGNLLICDMGGGTFDVSLVRINDSEEELKVLFNTGSGKTTIGEAGVNFDRAVVKTVLEEVVGKDSFDLLNSNEANELIELYEKEKVYSFNRRTQAVKDFESKIKAGKGIGKEEVFSFDPEKVIPIGEEIKVTGKQLVEVFNAQIKKSILEVLSKVHDFLSGDNIEIDKLLIVGGFGNFILVKKTILDYFKIGFEDKRYVEFDGGKHNYYAIARGAALVASDKIMIGEKSPYDVGITIAKLGELSKKTDFKLIRKGAPILDSPKTEFVEKDIVILKNKDFEIDFFISHDGKKKHRFHRTPAKLFGLSKDVQYKIGMHIDKSKVVYVVFKDTKSKKEYVASFTDLIGSETKIYFKNAT